MKIESKRLVMTQLAEADWALFHTLQTHPIVLKYCYDQPPEAEIKAKFQSRLPPWKIGTDQWLCLTMTLRATGEKIGVTGFSWHDGTAEIGYMLLPEFSGAGYASEALEALLAWSIKSQGIRHFRAIVTQGNNASEQVLLKNGFKLAAVKPESHQIGGQLVTDHVYTLCV